MKKLPSGSALLWRLVGYLLLIAIVGSILWSIWFETLLPLVREGDHRSLAFNLVGIPVILFGTGGFVYGGAVFVLNTFALYGDAGFRQRVAIVRSRPSEEAVREARKENLRILWRAWQRGLRWMVLGFAVIALGGFLINR